MLTTTSSPTPMQRSTVTWYSSATRCAQHVEHVGTVGDRSDLADADPLDLGVEHALERVEVARDERAIPAQEEGRLRPGSCGERTERHLGARVLDQHGIVRRADDRGAGRRRELREERADRPRIRFVEACRRLVREEQPGPRRERARDGDALALAHREARDALLRELLEPDGRERLGRAVPWARPRMASASSTLSSAVRNGTRSVPCVTTPMCSRRTSARWVASSCDIGASRTCTSPAVGRSRPASRCSSVDLPEPDGPVTADSAAGLELERQIAEDRRVAVAASSGRRS